MNAGVDYFPAQTDNSWHCVSMFYSNISATFGLDGTTTTGLNTGGNAPDGGAPMNLAADVTGANQALPMTFTEIGLFSAGFLGTDISALGGIASETKSTGHWQYQLPLALIRLEVEPSRAWAFAPECRALTVRFNKDKREDRAMIPRRSVLAGLGSVAVIGQSQAAEVYWIEPDPSVTLAQLVEKAVQRFGRKGQIELHITVDAEETC